jgi:CDP-diglyceride synthetase
MFFLSPKNETPLAKRMIYSGLTATTFFILIQTVVFPENSLLSKQSLIAGFIMTVVSSAAGSFSILIKKAVGKNQLSAITGKNLSLLAFVIFMILGFLMGMRYSFQ